MSSFWTSQTPSPLTVRTLFGQKGPNILDIEIPGGTEKQLEVVLSGRAGDVRVIPASGRVTAPSTVVYKSPGFQNAPSNRFWMEMNYTNRTIHFGYDVPIGSKSAVEIPMPASFPKVFEKAQISNRAEILEVYISDMTTLTCLGRTIYPPQENVCKPKLTEFGRTYPQNPVIQRLLTEPFNRVFGTSGRTQSLSPQSLPPQPQMQSLPQTHPPQPQTQSQLDRQYGFNIHPGEHPNEVEFATSEIPGVRARWQFGDEQFGTGFSTSHIYSDPGVYNATLTLDGPSYNDVQFSRNVEVPHGDAGFDWNVSLNGLQAAFESPQENVQWNFGDGTIGSGNKVTHTYQRPGTYTVTASINGLQKSKTISVSPSPDTLPSGTSSTTPPPGTPSDTSPATPLILPSQISNEPENIFMMIMVGVIMVLLLIWLIISKNKK